MPNKSDQRQPGQTREELLREFHGRPRTWADRWEEARTVDPSVAPFVRAAERGGSRIAEQLAPELFRWLGWSVAIAAIRVVALRVDVPWLGVVPWVLAWAVAMRISWFMLPDNRKSADLPDGGMQLPRYSRMEIVARVLVTLLSFSLAWVVAFGMSDAVARSDMLDKVLPRPAAVGPSS